MPTEKNILMYQIFALGVDQKTTKEKSLNVKGLLSTIELDFLPTFFSFSVLFTIQNAEFINGRARFKIVIKDVKTDEQLLEIGPEDINKSDLEVIDGVLHPGDFIESLNANLGIVNLKLMGPGYIKSEIYWNEALIGSTEILVKIKVPT